MNRALWIELIVVTTVACGAVAAIPLHHGSWGLSSDALNHHIYLGWISEKPRWHLDVLAAGSQSWQYPYLYWPVYRLTLLPLDGAVIGALWGGFLTALIVPPIWLTSLRMLPAQDSVLQGWFERTAAVALALSSVVVLSALGTTANDPLAAVPLLWAIAVMSVTPASDGRAFFGAAGWGISTAFKFSNALAIPLLLLWWWRSPGWPLPLKRGLFIAMGATAGFGLAYGPWGWQLWQQTGNPFYPYFSAWWSR